MKKYIILLLPSILLLIAAYVICEINNTEVTEVKANEHIESESKNQDEQDINNKVNHDYYPMTTVVREIDIKNDVVTVENNNGHLYAFTGVEDWQVGDICSLMLDNNGTESIFDDIILKAIYN